MDKNNISDENGNPMGGFYKDTGIDIQWQNGVVVNEPNGAGVECVLAAALSRLVFFQESGLKCDYNEEAIHHIVAAISQLKMREMERVERGVEGMYEV